MNGQLCHTQAMQRKNINPSLLFLLLASCILAIVLLNGLLAQYGVHAASVGVGAELTTKEEDMGLRAANEGEERGGVGGQKGDDDA